MKEKTLEQLLKRVEEDYTQLIDNERAQGIQHVIDNAYAIAHYNEVYDFCVDCYLGCNYEDEALEFATDEAVNELLKRDENLVKRVYEDWLNYNHPERYNFFCYEDLTDIIRDAWRLY
jgi:hypothetical protein